MTEPVIESEPALSVRTVAITVGSGASDLLLSLASAEDLAEAPVHHEHLAERADHDVGGLQVAVEHAAGVGVGHGLRRLLEHLEEVPALVRDVGSCPEERGQRAALDQLHREVRTPVRLKAYAVDRNDAGVLELGPDLRLLDEAGDDLRIGREFLAQHLQRDVAAQILVAPLVDDAHAAPRDLAHDAVPAVFCRALLALGRADPQQRRAVLLGGLVEEHARADAREALDALDDALPLLARRPPGRHQRLVEVLVRERVGGRSRGGVGHHLFFEPEVVFAGGIRNPASSGGQHLGQPQALGLRRRHAQVLLFPHDVDQGLAKLPASLGVLVVRAGRIRAQVRRDLPDRQPPLEPQPQDLDALRGAVATLGRAPDLQGTRLGDTGLGPGLIEESGGRLVPGFDGPQVDLRVGGPCVACRRLLRPPGDVSRHAVEEAAKAAALLIDARQGPVGAEALQEDVLRGIVDLPNQRRVTPACAEVGTDRSPRSDRRTSAARQPGRPPRRG